MSAKFQRIHSDVCIAWKWMLYPAQSICASQVQSICSGNDLRAGTLYSGQDGRSYTDSVLDNLVKYWEEFN